MKKRTIYIAISSLLLLSMVFCAFTFLPEVLPGDRLKVRIFLTINGKEMESQVYFKSRYENKAAEKRFVSSDKDGVYHIQLSGKEKGEYVIKFKCDSDVYQGEFKNVPVLGIDYIKPNDWCITEVDCHINLKKEDGKWIAAYRTEYSESGRGTKEAYTVRDNKILEDAESSLMCFGS